MLTVDLVLSSGFLAFGNQAGFLAGVEQSNVTVRGLCGTSSGALAGALWAAGMHADDILHLLTDRPPLATVHPHLRFWRGLLSAQPLVDELRQHLPPRFEDLDRPFAVGVVDRLWRHHTLRTGPLPEAVAASCAMPFVFQRVLVDGRAYADGGAAQRMPLDQWRAWYGTEIPTVAHVVDRSHGARERPISPDVVVVRTPRSGGQFWNLGPFLDRFEQARARTKQALNRLDERSRTGDADEATKGTDSR